MGRFGRSRGTGGWEGTGRAREQSAGRKRGEMGAGSRSIVRLFTTPIPEVTTRWPATHPHTHHHGLSRWVTILQGIRPFDKSMLSKDVVAGITLAALAIPEVMGYTKIAGTPVITGLYTILLPAIAFAIFGSSRHLVVGGDSATAAILYAGIAGLGISGLQPGTRTSGSRSRAWPP